jgi:DNA modification methylase
MSVYHQNPTTTLRQGHVLDVLASLPAESVQTCVTSPPYWGLRDYGVPGVEWPAVAFAPMAGLPELEADGWWLRSDVVWAKPNPMPESVTDRPTRAHEYVFLLAKSERYFYDAEAVREPAVSLFGRGVIGRGSQGSAQAVGCAGRQPQQDHSGWMGGDGETRNVRSVWTITPKPYRGAHFATMPPDLARTCILAGSRPGDVVLDPFNGAGTTGLVALQESRRFEGVELSVDYCQLSIERWRTQAPQALLPFAGRRR